MKAILVIDMPECCNKCNLIDNVTGNCLVGIVDGYDYKTIRRGCPLKPMPEKISKENIYWSDIERDTWNGCLDELLGEEE